MLERTRIIFFILYLIPASVIAFYIFSYFIIPFIYYPSLMEGYYLAYKYLKHGISYNCTTINRYLISFYLYKIEKGEYKNCDIYLLENGKHVRGVLACKNDSIRILDLVCWETCDNIVYFVYKLIPNGRTFKAEPLGMWNFTIFKNFLKRHG